MNKALEMSTILNSKYFFRSDVCSFLYRSRCTAVLTLGLAGVNKTINELTKNTLSLSLSLSLTHLNSSLFWWFFSHFFHSVAAVSCSQLIWWQVEASITLNVRLSLRNSLYSNVLHFEYQKKINTFFFVVDVIVYPLSH